MIVTACLPPPCGVGTQEERLKLSIVTGGFFPAARPQLRLIIRRQIHSLARAIVVFDSDSAPLSLFLSPGSSSSALFLGPDTRLQGLLVFSTCPDSVQGNIFMRAAAVKSYKHNRLRQPSSHAVSEIYSPSFTSCSPRHTLTDFNSLFSRVDHPSKKPR